MTMLISRRAALGTALGAPFVRTALAQQTFEFVAGSLGGGWYTMAAGLAALVREENADIQIRVVPGGGLANPTRINNGQSQMGWGVDAFASSAFKGEEPYTAKHEHLRCLGTGYSPSEHYLLRHPGAGPEDLRGILTQRGVKISVPQRSSTDELTLQRVLRFLGSSPDRIRSEGGRYLNGSYADIAAAYTDGQVDYLYCALARPAAILTEIAQGRRGGKLVGFPQDLRDHLSQTYAYGQGTLPATTYPTLQSGDLPLTTMDSVILVHDSVPEEVTYKITRTLIRNRGQRLVAIHASMGFWDPATSVKYPMPFHPGGVRAFREAGIAVG